MGTERFEKGDLISNMLGSKNPMIKLSEKERQYEFYL